MRKGQCPKCGSADVRTSSQVSNTGGHMGIQITLWSYARLENYVCVACGYVESYIRDASKLRKITEKWPKV